MSPFPLGILAASGVEAAADLTSYYLLDSQVLASTASTVTFSNLVSSYGSTYQHLQIRWSARTNRGSNNDVLQLYFNNDTGANYTLRRLFLEGALGLRAQNYNSINATQPGTFAVTGANAATDSFGSGFFDILDPFETTKNTTVSGLSGSASTYIDVGLSGGLWVNTAAVDEIDIFAIGSFVANSRFSLYGMKV